MIGTVKAINKEKGWGFIKGENGMDYFFHRSALKNVDFDDLERGRAVTFEDAEGTRGPRAEDIYV